MYQQSLHSHEAITMFGKQIPLCKEMSRYNWIRTKGLLRNFWCFSSEFASSTYWSRRKRRDSRKISSQAERNSSLDRNFNKNLSRLKIVFREASIKRFYAETTKWKTRIININCWDLIPSSSHPPPILSHLFPSHEIIINLTFIF